MKKLFYLITVVATLLFAAGCRQEKGLNYDDGRLVDVTFQVSLDGLQTKAFSDGTKADSLVVMVYKNDNDFVYLPNVKPTEKPEFENLVAPVNLKLVRGGNYRIVFWAMPNDPSLYTFDKENATVTVNIDGLMANDDNRDAFYGVWEGPVGKTGVEDGNVNLYRPYAQINVLTSAEDFQAAIDNGVVFSGSDMTVVAPTKLNFFDGSVSEPEEYSFDMAAITEDVNIPGYETYKYIAMNYILADEGSNVGDADDPLAFTVYGEGAFEADFELVNVPVRRNYRTILVGDIFCTDAAFQVTIQNAFGADETVPLEDAVDQEITFDHDSAPGQDTDFEYDATAKIGSYTMHIGDQIDFAGAFSSTSNFAPVYTSSEPTVGAFGVQPGDAPTLFTALAAGETVVRAHFNAVINGEEVKGEAPKNFKSADVLIYIEVLAPTVPAPMFEPGSVGEMEILSPNDPKVYLLIEDPEEEFADAVIYYKTAENAEWAIYIDDDHPIIITEETTIWAYASMEGYENSEVVWAQFKLEEDEPAYFQKVNEAPNGIEEGDYLIVYEEGALAFNGGLGGQEDPLDAVSNTIEVKFEEDGTILATEENLAAVFTIKLIADPSAVKYSVKSASGLFIGQTGNSNGLVASADAIAHTISFDSGHAIMAVSAGPTLQYNKASNQTRFRYFKTQNQEPIALYKLVGGEEPNPTLYGIYIFETNFGAVTSDKETAAEGETVTLTMVPGDNCHYIANTLHIMAGNDEVEYNPGTTADVFTFTMPAAEVTVTADFAENSGDGPYGIVIDPELENGAIVSDPADEAEEGATVTLTITPDEGYAYVESSLTVSGVDAQDIIIEPSPTAANVYEAIFEMPAQEVEISAEFELDTEGSGTAEDPYTVADALLIIEKALANGAKTDDNVYVAGVITSITEVSTQHGNATYYIGDELSANMTLMAYRGKYLANAAFTAEDQIQVGDEVVVYGQLYKYVKNQVVTPEFAQGNYLTSLIRPQAAPVLAIDGDFSEWANVQGIAGTGAIKVMKVIPTEDKYFFYLEADKTELEMGANYDYADYLTMCFDNGDFTGAYSKTYWGGVSYDFHIQLWLVQKGEPDIITWSATNFAHEEVADGDVLKYEFCWDRTTNDVFSGESLLMGAYVNNDNGSWTNNIVGFAPASDQAMVSVGEVPVVEPELAITVDGDMSDWANIESAYSNDSASRIREWKFTYDAKYLYFYIKMRRNRAYSGSSLYIGFDTDCDETTGNSVGDNPGVDVYVKSVPFINGGSEGETVPVCVNGFDTNANYNGTGSLTLVEAWGAEDEGGQLSDNTLNTIIEMRVHRSELTGVPTGTPVKILPSYSYSPVGSVTVTF